MVLRQPLEGSSFAQAIWKLSLAGIFESLIWTYLSCLNLLTRYTTKLAFQPWGLFGWVNLYLSHPWSQLSHVGSFPFAFWISYLTVSAFRPALKLVTPNVLCPFRAVDASCKFSCQICRCIRQFTQWESHSDLPCHKYCSQSYFWWQICAAWSLRIHLWPPFETRLLFICFIWLEWSWVKTGSLPVWLRELATSLRQVARK